MKITLYNSKEINEGRAVNDYRKVTAFIGDKKELILCCCDINSTAKSMWGDSGVEFYLTLGEENKNKLALTLGVGNKENLDKSLLDKIYERFGREDSCFEDIMGYFKAQVIDYKYDRW